MAMSVSVSMLICGVWSSDVDSGLCVDNGIDKVPRRHLKIYVFCFGKKSSTDILYDIRFESQNIWQRIFQNEYFSGIYVICLQRLQKTDKIATENEYSKKKDGPSHIVQVRRRWSIRNSKKKKVIRFRSNKDTA
jgi:hypothetical protein